MGQTRKIRPIVFSDAMVRAILEGRKTQTRRVLKTSMNREVENLHDFEPEFYSGKHNDPHSWGFPFAEDGNHMPLDYWTSLCPYGEPGDILWVREQFARYALEGKACTAYKASNTKNGSLQWKPAIYMPRSESRLTLVITSVRAERLQDITTKDAHAEGVIKINKHFIMQPELLGKLVQYSNCTVPKYEDYWGYDNARGAFFAYIDKLLGDHVYHENPWMWVIEFEPYKGNVDKILENSMKPENHIDIQTYNKWMNELQRRLEAEHATHQ